MIFVGFCGNIKNEKSRNSALFFYPPYIEKNLPVTEGRKLFSSRSGFNAVCMVDKYCKPEPMF